MKPARWWLLPLCIGYVLYFYSEAMFWSQSYRATLPDRLMTWTAYSILAAAMLCAMAGFRINRLTGLFVAGALFGWLGEGVLVQTAYGTPLWVFLSWTGLAWHALISVCIGWYGLLRALQLPGWRRAASLALGLGAFWGLWAVTWLQPEEGGHRVGVGRFILQAVLFTVPLMLCYWAYPRLTPGRFRASRWMVGGIIVLAVAWFVLIAVPTAPRALYIAPVLFGLTLLTLWRHRQAQAGETLLAVSAAPVSGAKVFLVLLMPVCAAGVYAVFLKSGWTPKVNVLVLFVTTPVGYLLWLGAVLTIWRHRRPAATLASSSMEPDGER